METFKLGKYLIFKNKIGKGTFSSVYKGIDSEKNIYVAVKKINRKGIDKMRKYIDKEIEIMKKLDHPNIIKLYDVIYDTRDSQENIYLILEYCPNGDLSHFFNKNIKTNENESRHYVKQLSDGLKYLTENNIFHRDLKPQNILVGEGNILKITDFGFAKSVNSSDISETFCGSPLYMAPEILTYQKYNHNADLWSVGVILYELLTGETPYTGNNLYDLVYNMKNNEVRIPNYKNLSSECKHLLFSLLQKDPDKRISWDKFYEHPWFTEYSEIDNLYNKIFEDDDNENNSLKSEEIFDDDILEEGLMFEFEEDLQKMNDTKVIKEDVIDELCLNDFVVISNSLPIVDTHNKKGISKNINRKGIINNIFDSIGNISSSIYSYAKSI
jgi:serine/threonine-protein kinase ULK/ATG1